MTDDEISRVYQTLQTMTVSLQQDPTLGPSYLADKIRAARALQDQAVEIITTVNRALSMVRQEARAQQARTKMARPDVRASESLELLRLQGLVADLTLLKETAHVRRQNLTRTSADTRLLLDCMKVGLMSGSGIDRHVRPSVVPDPVSMPADAATAGAVEDFYTTPVTSAPAAPATDDSWESLFTPEEEPPL